MRTKYCVITVPPSAEKRDAYPTWINKMDESAFRIVEGYPAGPFYFVRTKRKTANPDYWTYDIEWTIPLTLPKEALKEHREKYSDTYQRLFSYFRGEEIDGFSIRRC